LKDAPIQLSFSPGLADSSTFPSCLEAQIGTTSALNSHNS